MGTFERLTPYQRIIRREETGSNKRTELTAHHSWSVGWIYYESGRMYGSGRSLRRNVKLDLLSIYFISETDILYTW